MGRMWNHDVTLTLTLCRRGYGGAGLRPGHDVVASRLTRLRRTRLPPEGRGDVRCCLRGGYNGKGRLQPPNGRVTLTP